MSWTVDEHGAPVKWTAPPYKVGAVLRLVLTDEDPSKLSLAIRKKRIGEYYKLVRSKRHGAE